MNIKMLAVSLALIAVMGIALHHQTEEIQRLKRNQAALTEEVTLSRNRLGESTAERDQLSLTIRELKRLRKADADRIRRLGIRLHRAEALATTATESKVEATAPIHDTIILRDTLRVFRWRDAWVKIDGAIHRDSVACRVETVDTLRQVIHRVPRRFLFFRWGTKAIRQEVSSSNPHTRIVFTEEIKLDR